MPTNVTPEYKKAEKAYRRARDPRERLELLREMLRLIPKHKGTEHLQADIKSRIKDLTDDLAGPRKSGARTAPPTFIRPDGAAQVALVGSPNAGKSALHAALTGSHAAAEPYPFTTQHPQPGMVPVQDVGIQLLDLPSISGEHPVPWIANALQAADGCLLVVDLSAPGCVADAVELHELLAERKVHLVPTWPYGLAGGPADEDDPFAVHLPTMLVVNKIDLIDDAAAELAVFAELTGVDYPALFVSAVTGAGLESIGPALFERLGIVRVYTKVPHQPPDMGRPFTVRRGQTVGDVALLVHKEVAAGLQFARLWGGGDFAGQQVGRDHVVDDGDVLELRA